MKRLIFLLLVIGLFTNCQAQSKVNEISPQQKVCRDLITALNSENFDDAVATMDKIVFDKIPIETLKKSMGSLSNTLRGEFVGGITSVTFVTSEKTVLNDLPALFLIFKLESKTSFGFYFFYLNEKTNKVMLISRFTKIEPKRG